MQGLKYGRKPTSQSIHLSLFHNLIYFQALIEIVALTGGAVATTAAFFTVSKTAGYIMLPYIAWLSFASSLSYYIWKNNPTSPKIKEINDD
jgi:tryptophan-rich sensory protein